MDIIPSVQQYNLTEYTVLQRGDLRNKSEIKTVPSVQISFSSENDTFDFWKNPTYFHNLLYMTNLVRYREYLFNHNGTDQNWKCWFLERHFENVVW